MIKLKIGDLVYSKEHRTQGIVQSVDSRYVRVHLEGHKAVSRINRLSLFVKGDRVETQDSSNRWWNDNEYCFYAFLVHNPTSRNNFTVNTEYNKGKVSYVRNIRHTGQETFDFCNCGTECANYEPVDYAKEQMVDSLKLIEIEAHQASILKLIKELKK